MTSGSYTERFKSAADLFEQKIQSDMAMCDIHSAYIGPEGAHHNCLGDNFNDLTRCIHKLLWIVGERPEVFDYEEAFSLLAHLVNSVWERISDIFEIVSLPDAYKLRHFQTFIRCRRWANFFKHPKEFAWLVCFPKYVIDGTLECQNLESDPIYKIVNEDFLKKYYSADRCKGLAAEFNSHRDKVAVVLPDVVGLVNSVCDELRIFVDVVTKNPVYFEILNDKSTITDYYERIPVVTTTVTTTTTTPAPPSR